MADSPISSLPAVENLPNGQPNIETNDLFVLEHINDGQKRACKVSGDQVTKFVNRNVVAYDGSIVPSDAAGGANYDPDTQTLTLVLPHGPGIKRVDPPSNPGQPGAIDTYTLIGEDVRLTSGTIEGSAVGTFSVYNGMNGTGTVNTVANVPPNASTHDVPKADLINALAGDLFDMFWPVGSIYTSKTASVNPGDTTNGIFKRGTWQAITDRVILAAGTRTAGDQGGSETHTLTRAELPNVNIPVGDIAHGGSGALADVFGMWQSNASTGTGGWFLGVRNGTGTPSQDVVTAPIGSGDAFNTMMPYEVAYVWERTA